MTQIEPMTLKAFTSTELFRSKPEAEQQELTEAFTALAAMDHEPETVSTRDFFIALGSFLPANAARIVADHCMANMQRGARLPAPAQKHSAVVPPAPHKHPRLLRKIEDLRRQNAGYRESIARLDTKAHALKEEVRALHRRAAQEPSVPDHVWEDAELSIDLEIQLAHAEVRRLAGKIIENEAKIAELRVRIGCPLSATRPADATGTGSSEDPHAPERSVVLPQETAQRTTPDTVETRRAALDAALNEHFAGKGLTDIRVSVQQEHGDITVSCTFTHEGARHELVSSTFHQTSRDAIEAHFARTTESFHLQLQRLLHPDFFTVLGMTAAGQPFSAFAIKEIARTAAEQGIGAEDIAHFRGALPQLQQHILEHVLEEHF